MPNRSSAPSRRKPASKSAPFMTAKPSRPSASPTACWRSAIIRNATSSGATRKCAPANWQLRTSSAPTNGWAAFGYRSRRIVINTNHLSLATAPRSLLDLTNLAWRGKVALAYPQFGTTATHFHALRQYWGDAPWQAWCWALAANRPLLVDGNSVVVKMVGRGEAWIGLSDSDDITEGQQNALPIMPLPMDAETLLIPNTVGVIRDAPHPKPAQRLLEYLERPAVAAQLVAANALEGPSSGEVSTPTLKVGWDALLRDLDSTTVKLNEVFLR